MKWSLKVLKLTTQINCKFCASLTLCDRAHLSLGLIVSWCSHNARFHFTASKTKERNSNKPKQCASKSIPFDWIFVFEFFFSRSKAIVYRHIFMHVHHLKCACLFSISVSWIITTEKGILSKLNIASVRKAACGSWMGFRLENSCRFHLQSFVSIWRHLLSCVIVFLSAFYKRLFTKQSTQLVIISYNNNNNKWLNLTHSTACGAFRKQTDENAVKNCGFGCWWW